MPSKPRTGIPHFKATLKDARSSGNTFKIAILDIIDNTIFLCSDIVITIDFNGDKIHSIMISDNYEPGFENINADDDKNPFNMGHVKEGHHNDEETSEFGKGLKISSIFLGNKLSIFTRVGEDYYHVIMDFDKMSKMADPIESYEPTIWENISEDIYRQNHPFEYGSTIVLEKLCPENYSDKNKDGTIDDIQNWIQDAYSKILKKGNISIKVVVDNKDYLIYPSLDFFEDPDCQCFNTISKINIHDNNIMSCITTPMSGKVSRYSNYPSHSKNKKTKDEGLNSITKTQYDDMQSHDSLTMTFASTSTLFKNEKDPNESNITRGMIDINRRGRKYSRMSYKRHRNNGSQNYTYHKLDYDSKKINPMIGMNNNKSIIQPNTSLTKFLAGLQKAHEGKYSSDIANKVYQTLKEHARKNNIIEPEPIVDSEPESESESESEPEPDAGLDAGLDTEPEPIVDAEPEHIVDAEPDTDLDTEPEPDADPEPDAGLDTEPEHIVDAEPEPIVDAELEPIVAKTFVNQGPIMYYGRCCKTDKNRTKIPLKNGTMCAKIGYTNQSINKRFGGGGLGPGWEHKYYEEIDPSYAEKDSLGGNSKIKAETILIRGLQNFPYITFEENSTEKFNFPYDKRFEVEDFIINSFKSFRPQ